MTSLEVLEARDKAYERARRQAQDRTVELIVSRARQYERYSH